MGEGFSSTTVQADMDKRCCVTCGQHLPPPERGGVTMTADGVKYKGASVRLTSAEYSYFLMLFESHDVVTKERIYVRHYGLRDDPPEEKIIDVYMCKLRAKLKRIGIGDCINTVWGRGFVFRPPGENSAAPRVGSSGRKQPTTEERVNA